MSNLHSIHTPIVCIKYFYVVKLENTKFQKSDAVQRLKKIFWITRGLLYQPASGLIIPALDLQGHSEEPSYPESRCRNPHG